MKPISVLIILLLMLCSFSSQSQSRDVYNAYSLAKEIVQLERELKKSGWPGDSTKKRMERTIQYLIWYADKQDEENQLPALREVLERYPRIKKAFAQFEQKLIDPKQLQLVSTASLQNDDRFTTVFAIKGGDSLKTTLAEMYRVADSIGREVKTFENKLKTINQEITRLSNLQKDLYSKLETADTDTALLTQFSNVRQESENKVREQTTILETYNKTLQNTTASYTAIQKYLDKCANKAVVDKFLEVINQLDYSSNPVYRFEMDEDVNIAIANFQDYKEQVIQQNSGGALKFQLPDQSQIIDAIAIYLAKRVKQESIMWFFETIRKNADRYELMQTFFPNTITLLQSNEVYEIPNLGSQWRYALSKDFVKLPRHVMQSNWLKKWFPMKTANDSLVIEYLNAGFDISELLMQRYNYRSLIKQMYLNLNTNNRPGSLKDVTPRDVFTMLYAINEECFILNKKDSSYRILAYEDLLQMNKDELEIMLGIADMKYGQVFSKLFKTLNTGFEVSTANAASVRKWLGGIEGGIGQFQKIQKSFNETQEALKNGKKEDAVFSVFNLWETVTTLFDLVIPDSTHKPTWMKGVNNQSDRIKIFTKKGFEVYNQITLKNYAGAVNTVIEILEKLFYYNNDRFVIAKQSLEYKNLVSKSGTAKTTYPVYIDELFIKDADVKRSLSKGSKNSWLNTDTLLFKQTSMAAAVVFEQDRHAIQLIRKLAGFLNDVMLAGDSKQLARVVESYALPPGSYKRKRNSWWSVDLNAFVGAYSGYEFAKRKIGGSGSAAAISNGWVYGVTAPIGISLSKTFGVKLRADSLKDDFIRNPDKIRIARKYIFERGGSTFTITASIVDLGAVVSYRFNNTRDSVLPQQARWAQVFSPGVQLAYGFRNTPLVISAGYQYTPQLRKIDSGQPDPKDRQYNANRLFVGLLFDIPLINVWQRSFWGPKMKKKE